MDPLQIVQRANTYATNDGRYQYKKFVGEGAFGAVLEASDQERRGAAVAIKIIFVKKSSTEYLFGMTPAAVNAAKKEAKLLLGLQHQNIVAIQDNFKFKKSRKEVGFAIVMDYCRRGNLQTHLESRTTQLRFRKRFRWYQQLATALAHMHKRGVMHRDLKPANILIDAADNLIIADVGIAKAFYKKQKHGGPAKQKYLKTVAGTKPYMAPEVWDKHYTMSGDVFSIGLVMFVICELPRPLIPGVGALREPLGLVMNNDIQNKRLRPTSKALLDAHNCSKEELSLFDSMLQFEYRSRPTSADVLKTVKGINQQRRRGWLRSCICVI